MARKRKYVQKLLNSRGILVRLMMNISCLFYREHNRRSHSKKGSMPIISEKRQRVVREDE